jgi:hypothetical protein
MAYELGYAFGLFIGFGLMVLIGVVIAFFASGKRVRFVSGGRRRRRRS